MLSSVIVNIFLRKLVKNFPQASLPRCADSVVIDGRMEKRTVDCNDTFQIVNCQDISKPVVKGDIIEVIVKSLDSNRLVRDILNV